MWIAGYVHGDPAEGFEAADEGPARARIWLYQGDPKLSRPSAHVIRVRSGRAGRRARVLRTFTFWSQLGYD